jgi:serine/threonine protein kinase
MDIDVFINKTINGYKIISFIGEGTFGRTYLTTKIDTGKSFAMKI